MRFDGASLPGQVGHDGQNHTRRSDGNPGHLSFGPYFSSDSGQYIAGFYLRRIGGPTAGFIDLDVLAPGHQPWAQKRVEHADLFEDISSFITLPFKIAERTDQIEVRVFVHPNVLVEIQELVIFSTSQRMWSGK